MKKKRINKEGFMSVGFAIMFVISMPFASTIFIKTKTADLIYKDIDNIPKKEIAVVLGAAAYGDRLSDVLRDRVDTAIELYKKDKVEKIIMSGAENETRAMKNYSIKKSVPKSDIIEDTKGINTIASIQNISSSGKSVIIVSQKYHLPRALFIAKHYKMDAIGMSSSKHNYAKIVSFKKREILATTKAVIDIGFNLFSSL